ncbi:Charged multivesicular body protein 6 [Fukomys damarensis]|uniref:Charged multivesicular body protein 6 n=1 Tax=Fukomys damarensis TaxID=885580 RepID=A0A091DZK6_FUKDA|nr:Charged multivesicular body protein 6 [Fukomys damarensis]
MFTAAISILSVTAGHLVTLCSWSSGRRDWQPRASPHLPVLQRHRVATSRGRRGPARRPSGEGLPEGRLVPVVLPVPSQPRPPAAHKAPELVRTRRIREAIRTGLTRGYSSGFRGSKEAVREANPGVAVRVLPLLALRGRRREGERVRWLQGGDACKDSVKWALTPGHSRQQLKQQRDKLRQYQKRVTQQLERERALARQLLRDGRKERAKLLLKKKRYREQLLDRTENQISSLEAMVQSIEFTQIEMKVMEGLQVGNECLNKMHQVMSIEEVERILDETQEAVEYQRQIDELLAGSFTQEDEDAILEELNAITQEQIELPEVPSEPLPETHPEKAPVKVRSRQADLVAAS